MATSPASIETLEIAKEIEIAASIDIVYETLLEQLGPLLETPDGMPMPMILEPWPGGRWYNNFENHEGHFWGHVQVIEPPGLLEICGPHFMSYPALAHFQYRLTEENGATQFKFRYRVIGQLEAADRESVSRCDFMKRVRDLAERRNSVRRKDR